jgi:hypothetical protein
LVANPGRAPGVNLREPDMHSIFYIIGVVVVVVVILSLLGVV